MKYIIKSEKKSNNWEEGYFTGNGTVGGIVFCNPQKDKIIFNHESAFLYTTEIGNFPVMTDVFAELRESFKHGEQVEYTEKFCDIARKRGLINKLSPEEKGLYPNPFFPPFEMDIIYSVKKETKYLRQLNTATGEISYSFKDLENVISQRVFTSHKLNAVCIGLSSEEEKDFCFDIHKLSPQQDGDTELLTQCIKNETFKRINDCFNYHIELNRGFFDSIIKVKSNGKISNSDNKILVKNATSVYIVVSIGVNESAKDVKISSYDEDFKENLIIYQNQFFSSGINFKDNIYFNELSEKLFSDTENPKKQLAILQKLYYMGRYMAIGSFGKLPPNSQGLWSGLVNGKTFCDYITNIELPMAFWSIFAGNFADKAECCFDYIESLIPESELNAKNLFGANGIMITSRLTDSGLLFHFSPGYSHVFWISGGAWLAALYYEYYLYTHDLKFLKDRALPFMKKAADFYVDYIKNGEIVPSVSPENSPYEDVFCMTGKNATMDISAVKELFLNIDSACNVLGIENEYNLEICDYMYEEDGTLKEWADEKAFFAYSHRHISQMYAAMPGYEAKSNEKLEKGIRKAIEKRIQNGFYEEENGTCGWSMMHLLNVYARLCDNIGAKAAVKFFIDHYVRNNFTTCLTYSTSIFQIDANLGYLSYIYESLVYTTEDELVLLPAVFDIIGEGSANNLMLKGNKIIKELIWDKENVRVSIISFENSILRVKYNDMIKEIKFEKNVEQMIEFSA